MGASLLVAQVDDEKWAMTWAAGRASPLAQAIAYALEEEADSGAAEAGAG